jgi:hypothetical protein
MQILLLILLKTKTTLFPHSRRRAITEQKANRQIKVFSGNWHLEAIFHINTKGCTWELTEYIINSNFL